MRFPASVHLERLATAGRQAATRGVETLLITPSSDYAYLLGYHAPPLERLKRQIIRADGAASLVLPRLEEPLARHQLDAVADALELVPWEETDDPFALVTRLLGPAGRVAVQDQMWARFVLRLRAALNDSELVEAGPALNTLRRTKSPEEVDRLGSRGRRGG